MNRISTLVATTALALATIGAFAQTETPKVDARQAKQEARIDKGVASGALTARETRRLTQEQNAIDHAENHAKADGKVTAAERKRLARMQNHASRDIKRQKHDAQKRPAPAAAGG